jgi:urease alpha subunit
MGRRRVVLVGVLGVALVGAVGAQSSSRWPGSDPEETARLKDAPQLILYDGRISTVDARGTTVEAVAIRDGKILATGRSGPVRSLAGRGTKLVDLNGRRVLPGIIDGHLHGLRNGYHCFS